MSETIFSAVSLSKRGMPQPFQTAPSLKHGRTICSARNRRNGAAAHDKRRRHNILTGKIRRGHETLKAPPCGQIAVGPSASVETS
jgi:hypothetical protein